MEKMNNKNNNAFASLINNFNQAANTKNGKEDKSYSRALEELATAISYKIIAKCINAGSGYTVDKNGKEKATASGGNTLARIRSDLARGSKAQSAVDYFGSLEANEANEALTTLAHNDIGVGVDLKSVAILAILEEVKKQSERENSLPIDLERKYTERRLDKRVYIRDSTVSSSWKDVETTPIQEVYRTVRRYIMDNGSIETDSRSKYCYLADFAEDEEGNKTEDIIYWRLGAYADIGGYAVDSNNKQVAYTVDKQSVEDVETTICKLNLTARQAQILAYRQKGYGYKAIATALNVSYQAIEKTVKQIQKKAIDLGLNPAK